MASGMLYEIELKFMWDMFERCHLQAILLKPDDDADPRMDLGLRQRLGISEEYDQLLELFRRTVHSGNIYRMTDAFLCSYLILEIPQQEGKAIMLIGPFMTVELDREQILENAERQGLSGDGIDILLAHYASVPQLSEQTVYAPLETFCERLWGKDGYTVVDVNRELYAPERPLFSPLPRKTPEETMRHMEEMELRYAFENELMRAVSLGLSHKAELTLSSFSNFAFERRLADPVRNLKNYCIIMNTLLRKAAEQGGVHPLYLDRMSSDYAARIEQITSSVSGYGLMTDMFRGYCRLVRRHAMKNYSTPVRRAITHIDSDLNGELSLKTLAELQGMNASYLSSLFRKETGQTVTDYINQQRVHLAVQLLSSSDFQIQTIAQHCGIPDVNYFTKVFKKYIGKTPKQFRLESLKLAQEGPRTEKTEK